MSSLLTFQNHGILPFAGRVEEKGRLVRFWEETAASDRLRAMVISGEGGVGKSRLIEEGMLEIGRRDGAAFLLRLYPQASSSLPHLLGEAIWRTAVGRDILGREPGRTLSAVTDDLLRIARVRPTVVVIDNAHLLGGEGGRELALLLERAQDAPLSLLLSMRPGPAEPLAIVEPFLVDEMVLHGIDRDDVAAIWHGLFGHGDERGEGLLFEETVGNPLALRSALRAALGAGTFRQEPDGRWRVFYPQFAAQLERGRDLLADGMLHHLSDAERDAGRMIAVLGEVLARETATALLGGEGGSLNALLFKGILTVVGASPRPLTLTESVEPLLGFTHTLLHRRLYDESPVTAAALAPIVARDLPLYSALPFQVIAATAASLTATPTADLKRTTTQILSLAREVDATSDWELAPGIWRAGVAIVAAQRARLDAAASLAMTLDILLVRLALMRRRPYTEWEGQAQLYYWLTTRSTDREVLLHRLFALRFLYRIGWEKERIERVDLYDEGEALGRTYPEIRGTINYIMFLSSPLTVAIQQGSLPLVRRIEAEVDDLLATLADPTLRRPIDSHLRLLLLQIAESDEEFARRLRQMEELRESCSGHPLYFQIRLHLLYDAGAIARCVSEGEEVFAMLRDRHLFLSLLDCGSVIQSAAIAIGESIDDAVAAQAALLERVGTGVDRWLEARPFRRLIGSALLRGEVEAARRISRDHCAGIDLPLELRILLDMPIDIDAEPARATIETDLLTLHGMAAGTIPLDVPRARAILGDAPLYSGESLLHLHALAHCAAALTDMVEIADPLRRRRHEMVRWVEEREITGWSAGLRRLYGLRAMEREEARASAAPQSVAITMIGSIAVARDGGAPAKVRGARVKTLLGVMTAVAMRGGRLEREEFEQIAVGGHDDPDRARRTMHQAVLRLRELIGHEAVRSGEEGPRFDDDLVEVDLLRMERLIDEAARSERSEKVAGARTAMLEALRIHGGRLPFPDLFDLYFEEARERIEARLRRTALAVAERLRKEGDHAAAASLLEETLRCMPGDEEISALVRASSQ